MNKFITDDISTFMKVLIHLGWERTNISWILAKDGYECAEFFEANDISNKVYYSLATSTDSFADNPFELHKVLSIKSAKAKINKSKYIKSKQVKLDLISAFSRMKNLETFS